MYLNMFKWNRREELGALPGFDSIAMSSTGGWNRRTVDAVQRVVFQVIWIDRRVVPVRPSVRSSSAKADISAARSTGRPASLSSSTSKGQVWRTP